MIGDLDDAIFADIIFSGEGAVQMSWEIATRCSCYTPDTRQPVWDCPLCGGYGATFTPRAQVVGLFRSQSRWISPRQEGEIIHEEAACSFPVDVKPNYVDRRVRDRFTVTVTDEAELVGQVFYPAGPPTPFFFAGAQRAWRVQLQGVDQDQRLVPQP